MQIAVEVEDKAQRSAIVRKHALDHHLPAHSNMLPVLVDLLNHV